MNILINKNSSVVTALTLVAVAVSGVSFTSDVVADSHIVRIDANTGLTYNSALSNYRTLEGSENASWKQSNDTVGKIGGWRTYANEAYQANKRMEEEKNSQVDTEMMSDQSVEPEDSAAMQTDISTDKQTMIEDDETKMTAENNSMSSKMMVPDPIVGVSHQSATDRHRAYQEVTLQDWKAANDRVGEIGGWRTYANEAYQANKRMAEEEAGAKQ